jgi:hypothetical protein
MEVIEAFKEMQKKGLGGFKLYVDLIEPWMLLNLRNERMQECAEHSQKLFPNGKDEIHDLGWFYPYGRRDPERHVAIRRALTEIIFPNYWCLFCQDYIEECQDDEKHSDSWICPERYIYGKNVNSRILFIDFVYCPICQSDDITCENPENHIIFWFNPEAFRRSPNQCKLIKMVISNNLWCSICKGQGEPCQEIFQHLNFWKWIKKRSLPLSP